MRLYEHPEYLQPGTKLRFDTNLFEIDRVDSQRIYVTNLRGGWPWIKLFYMDSIMHRESEIIVEIEGFEI